MAAMDTDPSTQPDPMWLVVDLDALAEQGVDVHPGDAITLKNLSTKRPSIILPSGETFQATYKESIGTHMVYSVQHPDNGNDEGVLQVQYLCHTTNTLCTLANGHANGEASQDGPS